MYKLFAAIKKNLLLQSEKIIWTYKTICDEKDISAIKQKKEKQTRFQRENENQTRQKSFIKKESQRKKEIICFRNHLQEIKNFYSIRANRVIGVFLLPYF